MPYCTLSFSITCEDGTHVPRHYLSCEPNMAASRLNFRLATAQDAAKLEVLINTAFRDDPTTDVFLSADHACIDVTDVSALTAKIAQPDCAVLVATAGPADVDSSALVAHCSVRKLDGGAGTKEGGSTTTTTTAWFGMLAVDVSLKNRGLGSQVLAYAEDYVRREWGARRMEFDVVNTRAGLIAWYMRRGYQPTGETGPFPYDSHGNWRGVLRDDLHFILLGKNLTDAPTTAGVP